MNKRNITTTISLCGDILISRRLPPPMLNNQNKIKNILNKHECRFGNLETTILFHNEGYPELFPGGGYAAASPRCLVDIKELGFNLLNTATNHAMDYSHNGLLKTIENLNKYDIVFAGTGSNLSEASEPSFLECDNCRIALIGVTSSFHDSYAAGPQNQDTIGRPGVSPLRHNAIYHIPQNDYKELIRIAQKSGINDYHNMGIKSGYLLPSDNFKFGSFEFQSNSEYRLETKPNQTDLQRTLSNVHNAKIQADIVIVSIHSHQFKDNDRTKSPDFISTFAKKCIDEGADIIVCHGPHIIRGVEIYNNKPIFHGLGNFIFQHEQQKYLPEEFYNKYGTSRQESDGPGDIFNKRSQGGKIGLIASDDEWETIIVSMNVTNNDFAITMHPCEISKSTGLPQLSNNIKIINKLIDRSKEFGTVFQTDTNNCTATIKGQCTGTRPTQLITSH